MPPRRLLLALIVASCAVAAFSTANAVAITVTRFGNLGNGNQSYVRALSDDGTIAYGDALISGDFATEGKMFRMTKWTPEGGLQDLGNDIPTSPTPLLLLCNYTHFDIGRRTRCRRGRLGD